MAAGSQTTIISLDDYSKMGFEHVDGSGIEFSELIEGIINISLGLGILLAIVLLIKGGVEYVTTDTFAGKANGKETITAALGGLVLLFISFVILKTINPTLITKGKLDIAKIEISSVLDCSIQKSALSIDKWIEDENNKGDPNHSWSVEQRGYWGKLRTNPDGSKTCIANGARCAETAAAINDESIRNNGQTQQYARCIACPRGEDSTAGNCKTIVGDGTPDGEPSGELDVENDEVFLVFCRAFQTLDVGVFRKSYA